MNDNELLSVSYVGTLEHLAQQNGIISVRISCTKQIFKYCNTNYDNEKEFEQKGFVNIDAKNLEGDVLSCFMPGDRVELSKCVKQKEPKSHYNAHYFILKNLTLQRDKSRITQEWLNLDAL